MVIMLVLEWVPHLVPLLALVLVYLIVLAKKTRGKICYEYQMNIGLCYKTFTNRINTHILLLTTEVGRQVKSKGEKVFLALPAGARVGDGVGLFEGLAVGFRVGRIVGAKDGKIDGGGDGGIDGKVDGRTVGRRVGLDVGKVGKGVGGLVNTLLGVSVGDSLGASLGVPVGKEDGKSDSIKLGKGDGFKVGLRFGSVGAAVGNVLGAN